MEKRVFVLGNKVLGIVSAKKPSELIPFKGKFPLLSPALEQDYYDEVASTKTIDQVPEWVQNIIYKALKIQAIENGFKEFLKYNGIWDKFLKMDSSEKATELVRFLNANSMTTEHLEIN